MNEHPSAHDAEETPLPSADEAPLAVIDPRPPGGPPPRRQRGIAIVAGGLAAGVAVLLAAVVWLLMHPPGPSPEQEAALDALRQQMQALSTQVAALAARPEPAPAASPAPPADLGPLQARIAKLEQRPVPDPAPLAALAGRVDTLTGTLNRLSAKVDATAGRTDAATGKIDTLASSLQSAQAALTSNVQATQATLSNQVGAATQHLEALSDRVQAGALATSGRLDVDEKRLAAIEQATSQISGLAARSARADRLSAAAASLAAGEKLGDIPDAPPALQRYAAVPPPTEAALRLSYPAAARAAEAAEGPAPEGSSFAERIWSNVSQAVTIRDGDHVLIGGSAAPTLERARHLLDAGDLAGAVTTLGALSGPPAAAMAGWVADAKNLLAARAALAAMTARS
jgi:hypothetical protein